MHPPRDRRARLALITGAGGFIGGALARELQAAGYECRLHRRADGDLRQATTWRSALREVGTVFHLADQTCPRRSAEDPVSDLMTKAVAVLHLVRCAGDLAEAPVVVVAGSDTQAGLLEGRVDDATVDRPLGLQDLHKAFAEQYLDWGTRQGLVRGVALRFSTVYGPGRQQSSPDRGVVNAMLRRALRGEPLSVYGDGRCRRDFLHVEDAAAALRLAAEKIESVCGDHFVVGSGRSIALAEAFGMIADAAAAVRGERVEVQHRPWPAESSQIDRRSVSLDSGRFRRRTGWAPRREFEEGLRQAALAFTEEDA